ncbi:hypothetical protein DL98DRAFT_516583 [Cadophora sp. DSE1049]|nr:hypothetical protein DL98DRAFT_516583 [Cadophora sp. DSE1049]
MPLLYSVLFCSALLCLACIKVHCVYAPLPPLQLFPLSNPGLARRLNGDIVRRLMVDMCHLPSWRSCGSHCRFDHTTFRFNIGDWTSLYLHLVVLEVVARDVCSLRSSRPCPANNFVSSV